MTYLSAWKNPRTIDHWFDDFFSGLPVTAKQGFEFQPACDVRETEKSFHFSFDLPGLKEDEVDIEIDDKTLTVRGERKSETEEKEESRYFVERRFGRFERRFQLPDSANTEQVVADFKNGVLEVTVPKTPKASPVKVKIAPNKNDDIKLKKAN